MTQGQGHSGTFFPREASLVWLSRSSPEWPQVAFPGCSPCLLDICSHPRGPPSMDTSWLAVTAAHLSLPPCTYRAVLISRKAVLLASWLELPFPRSLDWSPLPLLALTLSYLHVPPSPQLLCEGWTLSSTPSPHFPPG